jgi:hypothetical protein
LADWGKVIGPNLQATAPGVAGLTAAKSGRSSATGAQLRLVRPHHRRGRNHRDAVLLAGGADAVRVRWRQSRALARERARSFRDIKHYKRRKRWLG